MVMEYLPILTILIVLIGALLSLVVPEKAKGPLSTVFTFASLIVVLAMLPTILAGKVIFSYFEGVDFSVDALSLLVLIASTSLGFLATLFSLSYISHEREKIGNYYTFFMLTIAGLIAIPLVKNIFLMYALLEGTTWTFTVLVAFRRDARALEASYKYLILSSFGASVLIIGSAIVLARIGSLSALDLYLKSPALAKDISVFKLCFFSFLIGFGVKAGIVPLHFWLPDAHSEAPSPVSAILSGVAIQLGAYCMLRTIAIMNPFLSSWDHIIVLGLGVITALVGAFMAMVQTDIKRMLAYSSVDEIGYILVGLGLGTFAGLNGAVFDIFNHTLMKGMLFLCAGTLIFRTGKRGIAEMGGLSRRMPITAIAFMIGSLGMAGVPPLNGFYSKYIIYKAAFDAGYPIVTILLIIASAIALGYYLKATHAIFFGETLEAFKNVREAPISMTIPLIALSMLCLFFGIVPQIPLTIVEFAVKALVGG